MPASGSGLIWTSLQPFCLGLLERGQHARMIGAGVLSDDENRLGQLEVFERHGSLAGADRFTQRRAARFVTHVGTVRKIVGAKLPDEELIEKSGFVAGAAGGVEDRLVGMIERIQFAGDQLKRVVPADGFVMRGARAQHHRMSNASLFAQPVIGFVGKICDAPLSEKTPA